MRAVLVGAVESTRIAARCLADAPGWELAALVTLPRALSSRHSDYVDLSGELPPGCRLIEAANGNSDEVLSAVEGIAPDYLFVIGWSQLCGERMMAIAPGRVVGYHPAPLPRLRGRGVIPWTILLQEPITAGTLFLIDAGTDSGPILAQRFFHVAADETAATLYARHMTVLAGLLPALLASLQAGTAEPQDQDDRYATWAARRRPEDGVIDWNGDAADIWRLVRACGEPYPGASTTILDQDLIVLAAEPVSAAEHAAAMPGQIVARVENGFVVRCGRGGLHVREWRWDRDGMPPLHACLGKRAAAPR